MVRDSSSAGRVYVWGDLWQFAKWIQIEENGDSDTSGGGWLSIVGSQHTMPLRIVPEPGI